MIKKHLTAILAGLACLFSLICLIHAGRIYREIGSLYDHLDNQSSMLRSELDAISGSVYDAIEQQASIISGREYEFGQPDMKGLTVPVTFSVTPKVYAPDLTVATLYVDGKAYPMELNNGQYTARFSLMLVEEVMVESVTFEEAGAVRTEQLRHILSPRGQFLPEVGASCGFSTSYDMDNPGQHTYTMNGDIHIDAFSGSGTVDIQALTMIEYIDGAEVSRTPLDLEEGLENKDKDGYHASYWYPMEQEYTLPFGSTQDIYIEAEDQYGFIHRCLIHRWMVDEKGHGEPDEEEWLWRSATGNLYTKDGKLVFQNYEEPKYQP